VNLTVTGGSPPYTYHWNNGSYTTEDLQNVPAGQYDVLITDQNGCTASDIATVSEPPQLTGNRLVTICTGDSFFTGGAYQTIPGIYYDTIVAVNGCDSILHTTLTTVDYFESSLDQIICYGQRYPFGGNFYNTSGTYVDSLLSQGGCDSIVTLTLTVLPDIAATASPESATLLYNDSISVTIFTSNPGSIISYNWSPASGISCANCQSATVVAFEDIRYTVMVIDSFGCIDTVEIPIIVKGGVIYVPNAFTPNGDGNNDIFKVYGNGFKTFRFLIFNRWGEKIFESFDPNHGWDGTYMGKEMNPGVYVYYIDIEFASGKIPPEYYIYKKGSVTLIR
jgi:gliding motility-associated-like protein